MNAIVSKPKQYIGTFKVVKVFRKSMRKQILNRGLTEKEAQRVVKSYPNRTTSLVFYTKQFSADKYFV